MKLKPHNKYICIKPIQQKEEEQENKFFLSSDMVTYQHYVYEVLNKSDDCTIKLNIGDKVIVLQNLVEEVKFNGEVLNVCPESGIVATIL
jgi:co-chaperonin GroES (HSP10)